MQEAWFLLILLITITGRQKKQQSFTKKYSVMIFTSKYKTTAWSLKNPSLAGMPKLAKELGLKLIASNDVHYLKHEHAIAHNIYLYISTDLSRDKEGKNMEIDLRYGTDQVYFKSAEQMCELFKDYPEAIQSTLEVAEKCNLELPKGVYHMPQLPYSRKHRCK